MFIKYDYVIISILINIIDKHIAVNVFSLKRSGRTNKEQDKRVIVTRIWYEAGQMWNQIKSDALGRHEFLF